MCDFMIRSKLFPSCCWNCIVKHSSWHVTFSLLLLACSLLLLPPAALLSASGLFSLDKNCKLGLFWLLKARPHAQISLPCCSSQFLCHGHHLLNVVYCSWPWCCPWLLISLWQKVMVALGASALLCFLLVILLSTSFTGFIKLYAHIPSFSNWSCE